jgi:hypothetical protein
LTFLRRGYQHRTLVDTQPTIGPSGSSPYMPEPSVHKERVLVPVDQVSTLLHLPPCKRQEMDTSL